MVLEQLELFFVEGCDAVAAGDHFGEDREGDLAELGDVAQQGGVDGVGGEDDDGGGPGGFEVEGDEALCVCNVSVGDSDEAFCGASHTE